MSLRHLLDPLVRVGSAPVLLLDTALYALAALFSFVTAFVAVSADYRQWGAMACGAYALGALVCLVAHRAWRGGRLSPAALSATRRIVVGGLILCAVVVPLFVEIIWRAEAVPGAHAQPEVATIERAGDRVAHHESPYLSDPRTVGVSPQSDAKDVDADSFFPYLPGMVVPGLVNALPGPAELQDARVALVAISVLAAGAALLLSDGTNAAKGRVVQFLVVLPTGALPMVTGGDDLTVIGVLLLGLVLVARRQPVLGGLVVGLAGTLKITAWPLLVVLALVARDRADRPAGLRYLAAVAAVVVPVLALGFTSAPRAFVDNVVRFPLGLARVASPAASPLIGQVLVTLFPGERRLVTGVLALVGVGLVAWVFARHRPRTVAQAACFTAFMVTTATFLAPATRFGYLIYPVDLVVFAALVQSARPAPPPEGRPRRLVAAFAGAPGDGAANE